MATNFIPNGIDQTTGQTRQAHSSDNLVSDSAQVLGFQLAGNTLIVDGVNGNDATALRGSTSFKYATVQAAITAALVGDNILIYPGTYTGAITLKNGITLQAYGSRGKVTFSDLVSFTPVSDLIDESCSIMYVDFNGGLSVDTTGKLAPVLGVVRLDSCRFVTGNINWVGRAWQLDNLQAISCAYNVIDCTLDGVTFNLIGGLAGFGTMTVGTGVQKAVLAASDLAATTTNLIVDANSEAQISRWGAIEIVTASGPIVDIWDTPITGSLTVNSGFTRFFSNTVETVTANNASNLVLDNASVNTATNINDTAFMRATGTFFNGTMTLAAGTTVVAEACDNLSALVNNGSNATIRACPIGSITSTGTSVNNIDVCHITGTVTQSDASFTTFTGCSLFDTVTANGSGVLLGYSSNFQTEITVTDTVFCEMYGGNLTDITANGTSTVRLHGGVTITGTCDADGGTVDGTFADLRFTTLLNGPIDRSVLILTYSGTAIGANAVAFNHSFTDGSYAVTFTEIGVGGGAFPMPTLDTASLTGAGFTFYDSTGGRDFQIVVTRFQANDV